VSTVTNQQVYELALAVQEATEELNASVGELLLLMKMITREISDNKLPQVAAPSIHEITA
jgi:hypothetical protein